MTPQKIFLERLGARGNSRRLNEKWWKYMQNLENAKELKNLSFIFNVSFAENLDMCRFCEVLVDHVRGSCFNAVVGSGIANDASYKTGIP